MSGSLPRSGFCGVAQAVDRLADDAADVHLGHADAGADLGLREVLGEAQAQDLALALVEHPHEPFDRGAVLGVAEARVLDPERGTEPIALLVVLSGSVEADRSVGRRRLAGLEHLLERRTGALGDLGGCGGAAELARELLPHRLELDGQLLQVARDADRPAAVAEVALELTE